LEEKTIYRMIFSGKNAQITCYAQIRTELEQFLFYALAPVKVPPEALAKAAEYLTRANYGLRIGNFELDYRDGEIRYKSSLDFEGVELTAELIRNTIYPAVQTLDRYMPGLMNILYADVSPQDAIQDIEGTEEA
jgi:hypothetical protein